MPTSVLSAKAVQGRSTGSNAFYGIINGCLWYFNCIAGCPLMYATSTAKPPAAGVKCLPQWDKAEPSLDWSSYLEALSGLQVWVYHLTGLKRELGVLKMTPCIFVFFFRRPRCFFSSGHIRAVPRQRQLWSGTRTSHEGLPPLHD